MSKSSIDSTDTNYRCESIVRAKTAQHSVHPTGGSLRVFKQFAWLEVDSVKMALSRPAHPRVTLTVRQPKEQTM